MAGAVLSLEALWPGVAVAAVTLAVVEEGRMAKTDARMEVVVVAVATPFCRRDTRACFNAMVCARVFGRVFYGR